MTLSFRLGKIPVRVQPVFLLMAAFLGASAGGLAAMAAWVAVVFASVLLHELGHAAACLAFGLEPSIELHTTGGTTSWVTERVLAVRQRVTISLAGPFAGFLLGGLAWAAGRTVPALQQNFACGALVYVNLGWGLLNLLPMLPLDGGNVMAQLLNGFTAGRGMRPAYIVSIVVAASAIPLALAVQNYWGAMMSLFFLSSNWRGLQYLRATERDGGAR